MDAVVKDGFTFLVHQTGLAPAIYYRTGRGLAAVRFAPNVTTSAGAIILGSERLTAEMIREKRSPVSVQGLLAHEFGHIVQFSRSTVLLSRTYHCELHADFLAGYFLGRSIIGDGSPYAITDFLATIANLADNVDETADAADRASSLVHGTREQRLAAAVLGYEARHLPPPQVYDLGERTIFTLADSFQNLVPQARRLRRADHDTLAASWIRIVSERTFWGDERGLPRVTMLEIYENTGVEPLIVRFDVESFVLAGTGAGSRRLTTQSQQIEMLPAQTATVERTVSLYPALDGTLFEVLGVRTVAFKRNIGSN